MDNAFWWFFLPAILINVFIIITHVFLCLWVYRDAKNRCVDAALWTVIVVLTSIIGMILYFVVGRKQHRTKCPSCFQGVDPNLPYCPACGAAISPETIVGYNVYEYDSKKKRSVKAMKIAFFVSLGICVVSTIAWFVFVINVAMNGKGYQWERHNGSGYTETVENSAHQDWQLLL